MLPTNRGGLEPIGMLGIKSKQHNLDYGVKLFALLSWWTSLAINSMSDNMGKWM